MRRVVIALMILLVLLAACKPAGKKGEKIELTAPFVGGTTGVVADFVDFRKDVFDGSGDPFDVVVKLENKGETTILANRARVKLSGINPAEFGKSEAQLVASPQDDVLGLRKDPQGTVIPGSPVFVEFTGLNHATPIAGARVTFPLRAEVCYLYGTKAVSKLCVRENILAPEPEGICEINEDKPVFNSGAPVQVSPVKEVAQAKDKIRFSFEIRNAGTGQLFERGSACDHSTRAKENKAYVIVDTGMPGVECTGFATTRSRAEGLTTLFEGKKIVTCTQPVSRGDFEQQISIEVIYDYEEYKQTELTVKSSGEIPATS